MCVCIEGQMTGVTTKGPKWAYEDFETGIVIELGPERVTAEAIVDFAGQFDPQPMHLDAEAGKASLLGGLAASGWHSCALLMRMMCDAFLLDSTSQGAPGVEFTRWKRPVMAGDTLSGQSRVLSRRLSRSRPGLGFVTMRHELFNQHRECVLQMENMGMFRTRAAP